MAAVGSPTRASCSPATSCSGVNSTTHVGMYIGGGKMIHSNYNGVEIASAYYSAGSFVGGGPIA